MQTATTAKTQITASKPKHQPLSRRQSIQVSQAPWRQTIENVHHQPQQTHHLAIRTTPLCSSLGANAMRPSNQTPASAVNRLHNTQRTQAQLSLQNSKQNDASGDVLSNLLCTLSETNNLPKQTIRLCFQNINGFKLWQDGIDTQDKLPATISADDGQRHSSAVTTIKHKQQTLAFPDHPGQPPSRVADTC